MPRSLGKDVYRLHAGSVVKAGRKGKSADRPERIKEPQAAYTALTGGCKEPLPRPWNRRIVLELVGDPLAELNPNLNARGYSRDALMAKIRRKNKWMAAMTEAWERDGAPVFTVPVRIQFDIRRGRLMDPDNCLAGLKNVIDSLTTSRLSKLKGEPTDGMIPDDSGQWVEFAPVTMLTGGFHTQNPIVYVIVTPLEPLNSGLTTDLKQADTNDACLPPVLPKQASEDGVTCSEGTKSAPKITRPGKSGKTTPKATKRAGEGFESGD